MGWGATRSGKRPLLGFSGWKESSKQSKTKNPGNKNRSQPVHGLQSAPGTGRVGSRDTAQCRQQHVLRRLHLQESRAADWLQRVTVLTGTRARNAVLLGFVTVFVGERKAGKEKRVGKARNGGSTSSNMEPTSVGPSNTITPEEPSSLMLHSRI